MRQFRNPSKVLDMTRLILLRHGDRDHGFGDVPLSTMGRQQAQGLTQQQLLLKTDVILSSPKLRAQQTVKPLSETLQLNIKIDTELDQRKSIESSSEFEQRVHSFMTKIADEYQNKTVIAASHSDWLQVAVLGLKADSQDLAMYCFFACAEFLELSWSESGWKIHGR